MWMPILLFSYWLIKSLETMAMCDEEIKKCGQLLKEIREKEK